MAKSSSPKATISYKKKPLGEWPDDEKHQAVKSPQRQDEESRSGRMPDPEQVEDKTNLEEAHDMDIYKEADEEHPQEVNIADEIQKAEDERK